MPCDRRLNIQTAEESFAFASAHQANLGLYAVACYYRLNHRLEGNPLYLPVRTKPVYCSAVCCVLICALSEFE